MKQAACPLSAGHPESGEPVSLEDTVSRPAAGAAAAADSTTDVADAADAADAAGTDADSTGRGRDGGGAVSTDEQWTMNFSAKKNFWFYTNKTTGESTWQCPEGVHFESK